MSSASFLEKLLDGGNITFCWKKTERWAGRSKPPFSSLRDVSPHQWMYSYIRVR